MENIKKSVFHPYVRPFTCSWCKHLCREGWTLKSAFCTKTKRSGNVVRGMYCKHFEEYMNAERQLRSCLNERYLQRRQRTLQDYRTAAQWEKANRGIFPGAVGRVLWANSLWMYVYYLPEDTYDINNPPEALEDLKEIFLKLD